MRGLDNSSPRLTKNQSLRPGLCFFRGIMRLGLILVFVVGMAYDVEAFR